MSSSQRTVLKNLFKKLKKRYTSRPVVLSQEREVLEHLIYASFLENASFDAAQEAFSVMERYFIDWNEIRVTTARELQDVLNMLPNSLSTGERLRRFLQWVFDTIYKFDLEDYRHRDITEVREFLSSIPYSTPFMNAYLLQLLFDGNDIPLDEGAWRVFRLLEVVEISNENKECVPELNKAIDRKERFEFFLLLHCLAAELMSEATSDEAIKFLTTVDSEVPNRTWLPLVESTEITDPVEIARMMARKEKKSRPSMMSFSEMDMLDDTALDPELMVDEEGGLIAEDELELNENVYEDRDFSSSEEEFKSETHEAKDRPRHKERKPGRKQESTEIITATTSEDSLPDVKPQSQEVLNRKKASDLPKESPVVKESTETGKHKKSKPKEVDSSAKLPSTEKESVPVVVPDKKSSVQSKEKKPARAAKGTKLPERKKQPADIDSSTGSTSGKIKKTGKKSVLPRAVKKIQGEKNTAKAENKKSASEKNTRESGSRKKTSSGSPKKESSGSRPVAKNAKKSVQKPAGREKSKTSQVKKTAIKPKRLPVKDKSLQENKTAKVSKTKKLQQKKPR